MNAPDRSAVEILPTDTTALFDAAVARAAELLRSGDPVALPTETVYGLAANALDAAAVARLFEIKGRPAHNPIIVHVGGLDMARRCVTAWPVLAGKLARAFWPGPLTLVLPRAREIPDIVTAGGPTVGVRWSSHPLMQAVIRTCGFPLAAPSANPSGCISPTNAEHVRKYLGDKIRLIVDGGQAQVGIESTVLDVSVHPPRVLRPGMIHAESLQAVTGEPGAEADANGGPVRSPGRLPRHYSPRARLVVASWRSETELRAHIIRWQCRPFSTHIIAHTQIPSDEGFGRVAVIPHDPDAFARAMYAELHRCDEGGAECIVVETPPAGPAWRAIADRLQRGAAR